MPSPVPASRERQQIELTGDGFKPGSTVTVGWNNRSRVLSKQQVQFLDERHLKLGITTGRGSERWWVQVATPDGSESERLGFDVKASSETGWWKQQPAGSYTLQLLAASRRETVDEFLQTHKLDEQHATVSSRRGEQPLFLVIQGSYPDKTTAEHVAESLGRKLNLEPWPRPLAGLE